MRRLIYFVVALSLFLRTTMELRAAPTDYLVDVWDTENNLPSSTVTAMAQTPDGYLWVGSYNGLARFDGVRFVNFDPVNTPQLSHPRVQGLYVDTCGTLWINTFRGGLTSYRNGIFRNEWPDQSTFDLHTTLAWSSSNTVVFVTQFGVVLRRPALAGTNINWNVLVPSNWLRPIFQCAEPDGTLWFLTREGRALRLVGGKFEELPPDAGLGSRRAYTLATDAKGRVWVGAENQIGCWNGHQFDDMTPTNGEAKIQPSLIFPTTTGALWILDGDRLRKQVGREWVSEAKEWRGLLGSASGRAMGMHEDREGGVWFNHYGNGLFHILPNGNFQHLTAQEGMPGDRVGAWFQSRNGGIWAGVDRGGLARLRDRRFHVIGAGDGLGVRTALSVCDDTNGMVWIGTAGGGLCQWSNGKILRYPVGASLSANFVFSVFPKADGGLWLSASEGEDLYEFQAGKIQRSKWEMHGVKSLLTDHAGRIWVGTKSGIGWWQAGQQGLLGVSDGVAIPSVRALAEMPGGEVWAGSDDGTLYRCETNRLQAFRPKDALAEQPIYSLLADRDGTLWAGTFRGGLLRFKDGKFTRFSAAQGLPVDVISQILEDQHGRLWLGTHQGIYCVAKAALEAYAAGKISTVDYVTYGRHDGLPALECSDGYQPACWHGQDGKLWFTTVRGVIYLNPDELTANSPPPPVLIEEFRVDGELIPLHKGRLVVPPGHKQFEFQFTALNFDASDKTRFRYRIDGVDAGWVEADTRRTAHYGLLPPRDYQFRVIACNNDGVWSETGAKIAFTVKPFFYETWWFTAVISAGIIGGVALTVRRIAARKYQRRLARLEQQHAVERDRARIAKDIHDDIGAGLTQITLLSELARREPAHTGKHLDRILGSARQLTRAMDEIVWAVDPQHDTFNGLMDYISAFAEDFLRTADIRCRMDFPSVLPETRVDAEMRYNLFLALKETLNNVVKHSQATEVWLRLQIEPDSFILIVEDNGQGLSMAGGAGTVASGRITSGSGLINLEKRLAAIGGRCVVRSVGDQGTRVEMKVAFKDAASPIVVIGRNETFK